MFVTLAETLGFSEPYLIVAIAAIVALLVADLATSRNQTPDSARADGARPKR